MKNEVFKRKLDLQGNPILDENGDFINELVSIEEIPNKVLTDFEKKQMQYVELLPTDWYFVRKVETGIEVPSEILEQRTAIRNKYS